MSKVLTDYTIFNILDYTGSNSLSSYSLPITPLTFSPIFKDGTIDSKVLWNFGDGTSSRDIVATKYYEYPGEYEVELFIFDCSGQTRLATYSALVSIYDYIENTFTITTNISSLDTGEISDPIVINSYTPRYQQMQDIVFEVNNSNSPNFFRLENNSYNHLKFYNTLLSKNYLSYLSPVEYEFVEISKIEFNDSDVVPVYVKIKDSEILPTLVEDSSTVYAGASSTKTVYFKDDKEGENIGIEFTKDSRMIHNNPNRGHMGGNLNTFSQTVTCDVVNTFSIDNITITSNGLDGEGGAIQSFNVPLFQIQGVSIPFVAKFKKGEWTNKTNISTSINVVSSTLLHNLTALSPSLYDFEFDVDKIFENDNIDYISGSVKYNSELSDTLENVQISIISEITYPSTGTITISGTSDYFNIYPNTVYTVYKQNEDYNLPDIFRNLRFQEILLDNTVLFDNVLGSIFGDDDGDYTSLGKVIYERITNFNDNVVDITSMHISNYVSLAKLLSNDTIIFDRSIFKYPVEVERLANLFSINKTHLLGYKNTFCENFDMKGITTREEFGKNLGDQLDTSTYIVTAGTDIVAYEKFSGSFTKLNTYQPELSTNYFPLSTYSNDWGWGLVLSNNYSSPNLKILDSLYEFYSYVDTIDGTISDSIIDFDNQKTTLEYDITEDDMFSDSGIVDNIIQKTLISALELQ